MTEYCVEPGQEVVIERFTPEYAEGVAKCFNQVYGEGYPIDTYINPKKLIEENRARRVISVIARTINGQVVGHVALFNSDPCNLNIYESGSGVVIKEYRNTAKLFSRMAKLSEDIALEEGIHGIYGEPVCNHPFSQKMTYNLKWITTALEVDLMPASAYEKEGSASGRVSVFWGFKTLVPNPHTVYLPKIYKDFFRLIYKRVEDKRDIKVSTAYIPPDNKTNIDTYYFEFANVLRMAIKDTGNDFEEKLEDIEKEAKNRGILCFQAWLNLGKPYVGEAVEILRKRGYFIGGLLTRWFDTDGILMQKLITKPCWDDIVVAFEHDKIILEAAYNDWKELKH